jgi:hypothetical protein
MRAENAGARVPDPERRPIPDPVFPGVGDRLARVPDGGPETGHADNDRAAYADDGGQNGGVHGGESTPSPSATATNLRPEQTCSLAGW